MKSIALKAAVAAFLLAAMGLALASCSGQDGKVSNRPQNAPGDWEKKNITIDG